MIADSVVFDLERPFALDTHNELICEVQRGLSKRPRSLAPWIFYDAQGSDLFERITVSGLTMVATETRQWWTFVTNSSPTAPDCYFSPQRHLPKPKPFIFRPPSNQPAPIFGLWFAHGGWRRQKSEE